MKKSSALAYVGHNANGDREKDDFYPTPENATQSLLDKQKFEGNIWECACGNGAMSKVMIKNGYDVYSSDLINRDYGEIGIDF
jgi:2-polyprenyl-3-methyl-5-hydroxy-6-metoxy-1,4-benzoquinol methylase